MLLLQSMVEVFGGVFGVLQPMQYVDTEVAGQVNWGERAVFSMDTVLPLCPNLGGKGLFSRKKWEG